MLTSASPGSATKRQTSARAEVKETLVPTTLSAIRLSLVGLHPFGLTRRSVFQWLMWDLCVTLSSTASQETSAGS